MHELREDPPLAVQLLVDRYPLPVLEGSVHLETLIKVSSALNTEKTNTVPLELAVK